MNNNHLVKFANVTSLRFAASLVLALLVCTACPNSDEDLTERNKNPENVTPDDTDEFADDSTDSITGMKKSVDLGLSVKWATFNVGASSPEENGDYYAWGEVDEKSEFTWDNYTHKNNDSNQLQDIGSNISGTSYDIAHVKWGENWRMPTNSEWMELQKKCTWTWINKKGKMGYKVTSKSNDSSIFLPAAGYHDIYLNEDGKAGHYWSASLVESNDVSDAWFVLFSSDRIFFNRYDVRYLGFSVRPVCP